jgi:hypothetical protein
LSFKDKTATVTSQHSVVKSCCYCHSHSFSFRIRIKLYFKYLSK